MPERHTLATEAGRTVTAARDFVMRCWTRPELASGLRAGGLGAVEYATTCGEAPPAGGRDRMAAAALAGR